MTKSSDDYQSISQTPPQQPQSQPQPQQKQPQPQAHTWESHQLQQRRGWRCPETGRSAKPSLCGPSIRPRGSWRDTWVRIWSVFRSMKSCDCLFITWTEFWKLKSCGGLFLTSRSRLHWKDTRGWTPVPCTQEPTPRSKPGKEDQFQNLSLFLATRSRTKKIYCSTSDTSPEILYQCCSSLTHY